MVDSWIDGDGEIRVSVVGAGPRSVNSKHHWFGGGAEPHNDTQIVDEVNSRLPRFGLRKRVLRFVQLDVEAVLVWTTGRWKRTKWILGRCRCECSKKKRDEWYKTFW